MKKVLVIDNYDSFVYNLVHLLKELGAEVVVKRNDKISLEEARQFQKILLSPGPGIPLEAGIMPELVRELGKSHSILGVCLGHQCIGEVFGGTLENMTEVCHGKGLITEIIDPSEPLFRGVPTKFMSARYHSWVVSTKNLPGTLKVTAVDDAGRIMALSHKEYDVRGVQFHPESVLTDEGRTIIHNWLSL